MWRPCLVTELCRLTTFSEGPVHISLGNEGRLYCPALSYSLLFQKTPEVFWVIPTHHKMLNFPGVSYLSVYPLILLFKRVSVNLPGAVVSRWAVVSWAYPGPIYKLLWRWLHTSQSSSAEVLWEFCVSYVCVVWALSCGQALPKLNTNTEN